MSITFGERFHHMVENAIALEPDCPLISLMIFALIMVILFGELWTLSSTSDIEPFGEDWVGKEWVDHHTIEGFDMALQILLSGGKNDWENLHQMFLCWAMILFCLIIFTVFISMITDQFSSYMESLKEGRSKIPSRGHVLILGWNEATVRLVCQLAFLREQLRKTNSTFLRRIFFFMRVKGATPIASAKIVVACNTQPPMVMAHKIREALEERGIRSIKVGLQIVVADADPSNLHDLARVGAQRARRILIMETARDEEEFDNSDGKVQNGATLRTILCLRHLLQIADPNMVLWNGKFPIQIVAQLQQGSDCVEACNFRSPEPENRLVVTPMDLTRVLNSLLFNCVSTPGLANVLVELLSFEGVAIRCRVASELPEVLGKRVDELDFVWQDSTFLGYIQEGDEDRTEEEQKKNGLAPDNIEYTLKETDLVLYAARTPSPDKATYKKASGSGAGGMEASHHGRAASQDYSGSASSTLICGWRHDWSKKGRFRARMEELIKQCWPGSHIHFLCMLESKEFEEILEHNQMDVKLKSGSVEEGNPIWSFEHIEIGHTSGDSSNFQDLRGELTQKGREYSAVVVLGTVADPELDNKLTNYSRDTRVLRTILCIRQLHHLENRKHAVHILGENSENSTSMLAPIADPSGSSSDFVNTHAMFARTLAQALCFPKLYSAVTELLSYEFGTPRILIVAAETIVKLNESNSFASIIHIVRSHHDRDICLGIFSKDNIIKLSPDKDERFTLVQGDRIIVLTRRMTAVEIHLKQQQSRFSPRD